MRSLLIILAAFFVIGCSNTTPVQTAEKVRTDTIIQAERVQVFVGAAQSRIEEARVGIREVRANPSDLTPLDRADDQLGDAQANLARVAPTTQAIASNANSAHQLTVKESKRADQIQAKLDDERDNWLGYKARTLLWWVLGGGFLVTFVWTLISPSQLFPVLGSAFTTIANLLKTAAVWLFHVATGGGALLAGWINRLWEKKVTTSVTSPVTSPVTPPAINQNGVSHG